ncbi:MAG: hypothetical protein KY445_06445 [Armatimonadetes bacterium]|nr:hypothetical protein [Armatimonadota bacterium]
MRIFIYFVLLFVSVTWAKANPAAGVVVPGKSLGALSLGMTSQQVEEILGSKPVATRAHVIGASVLIWFHHKEGESEDTTLVAFINDKAIYLEAISPAFTAPGRLSTSTDLASLVAKNNNHKLRAYEVRYPWGGGLDSYVYDDVTAGISYIIWADGHFNHQRRIDAIAVHRPGLAAISPLYSKEVTPILNKPEPPLQIPTGKNSPNSINGLPLTEIVSPDGIRGYTTKPVVLPNGVGILAIGFNSFQGKKMPPYIVLYVTSFSKAPRWVGINNVTFSFSGRKVLMYGQKSTNQMNSGIFNERIDVKMPLKYFLSMAKSNSLYVTVAGSSFTFKESNLIGLRTLAKKLS